MCVNTFKHEYLRNQRKFYLKHHWGGGKAALGFGPDRIGTLVSMATDSSHILIGYSSFLQVLMTTIKSWTSSNFGPIRPWTAELSPLERLKKFP